MSGISSASAGTSSTVGTNLAPITFPGIASGIDYNTIVTKLTSLTLAPNTQYNAQISELNAKNAELIKINTLFASVQATLTALSDPATFSSYTGTTTDPLDAGVTQIAGQNASPGTYTVMSQQVATSTQITGAAGVGVAINPNLALVCAGTAITPTNGTNGQVAHITIDGVSVNYDVTSQSLNTIVANIYASVHATDAGFTISAGAGGAITVASSDQQVSIGATGDNGNLAAVLKLNVAQVQNGATSGTVVSAGPLGGVNETTQLYSANNAGFATVITAGAFTINGVQIKVDPYKENVADVLSAINASTAGVVAAFDMTSDTFTLTNATTGASGIVVGASGDQSNFLTAAHLVPSGGASTTVGTQAYVAVRSTSGALVTTYSNSDSVAGAIAGMSLNVTGSTSTPYEVTISQSSTLAVTAIQNFVSAYNAAINEISVATAPPVVQQSDGGSASVTTSSSTQLSKGGVLYGDQTIEALGYQLTDLVTAYSYQSDSAYNSLTSVGLSLDSTHTVYQSNTNAQGGAVDSTTSNSITAKQADGTSGMFAPLDVAAFTAAFAAQPTTVASLFTSTSGLANQLGSYLTQVTGGPTFLADGTAGTIPIISLLQNDENTTTSQITSLNESVKEVTDKANAQADLLRAQFTASEALISKYQSEQSAVNQLGGTSSTSSSS